MHNPLVLFNANILQAFLKAGHTHFVRQSYPRGMDRHQLPMKGSYLITHYREEAKAQIHYDALTGDKARFLYEASQASHLQRLQAAALQPAGYRIYSALLAEKKWRPPLPMKAQIKQFISTQGHWQPKGSDAVNANLFFQFGELFITLTYGAHEVKVPLHVIERF